MAAASVNANILRRSMIALGTAFKAAFTGGALALTAIAFVAVPAIIARFERLRAEARELEEALKSIQSASAGAITPTDTPDLFAIATDEIKDIEAELVGVNRQGEQLNEQLIRTTNLLKTAEGDTRTLEVNQALFTDEMALTTERAVELETRLRQIRVAIGEIPPFEPLTPMTELQFEATLALAANIRERVDEAVDTLDATITFSPELEERELVQVIGFIRKEIENVVSLSLEGFNFLPDGPTITMLNNLLAIYNARLEELRDNSRDAKTPTDELNAILEANANALITLNASIGAGLVDAGERFRREVSINRDTIRDLLVLRERFANLEGVDPAFLDNLDTIVQRFRNLLPESQFVSGDLFTALFDPRGRASEDIVLGFDNLFTETENVLRGRVDDLLLRISQVRGAGEGPGLIDIFPNFNTGQFESQIRAEEEFYVRATNVAGVGIQRQRDIIQRGLHEIEAIQIGYTDNLKLEQGNQLRAYSDYGEQLGIIVLDQEDLLDGFGDTVIDRGVDQSLAEYYEQQRTTVRNGIAGIQSEQNNQLVSFDRYNSQVQAINSDATQVLTGEQEKQLSAYAAFGNEIGVYIIDQATMLRDLGEITEEQFQSTLAIVGTSTEGIADNTSQLQRALATGFEFEVPPQARALANFALTLGEAVVSTLPTIGNFAEALGILIDGSTDVGPALLNVFNTLASGISLIEQPILAGQDALISLTEDYETFLENFVKLSDEQREAVFNAFPTEVSDRLRSIVADYEEVYARVGDAFNADAFRLLPTVVQDALEDAFRRFHGAEPILRSLYSGLVDVIEAENITIAERTRPLR